MAEKGGQTTQAGIDYQNKIATLFLGRMIDPGPWKVNDEIIEVRNEDPTAEVDDVVVRYQDHTVWIQVKLDMQDAGDTWVKFWKHMLTQWWQRPLPNSEQDRLVLAISQTPDWVKQLEEICGRAYGSRKSPELASLDQQVAEWQDRLSEKQQDLIGNITDDVSHKPRSKKASKNKAEGVSATEKSKMLKTGDPVGAEYLQPAALFGLFSHMEVWTQFNPYKDNIERNHGRSHMPRSNLEWDKLFDCLFRISGDKARYGKSISRQELIRELSQKNIVIAQPGGAFRRKPLPPKTELPEPGDLPPASLLPFPPYAKFTGRKMELLALAEALFYEHPGGHPVVALTAMGGMGKSQLAVELAYRYGRFLDGVHWINAATDIPAEIIACGQAMQLERWPDEQPEQVAATLKAWQEGAAGGELRLVVLDNLEDPVLLGEWLPRLGALRLLVTTRRTDFEALGGVQLVELHSLPRQESLALLRKLAPHLEGSPDAGLEQVAERLGDLPLGLQLAGSYLGVSKLNPLEYLDLLQQKGGDLAKLALPERLQDNPLCRELNLWRTFTLSWNQLQEDDPSDQLARQVFLACGYCAPNTVIPLELLQKAAACEAVELEISLESLYSLGLLQRALGGPMVHPMLAEYARSLDHQADHSTLPALAQALGELATQASRTGFPTQFLPLRPHLPAVGDVVISANPLQAASLWNVMGYHLLIVADYAGARSYLEKALIIRKQMLGEHHLDTANSLNNLGGVLYKVSDLTGARLCFEQALVICREMLGEQHPHTADSMNNLGLLLQDMGDLPAARFYLEQALSVSRKGLGEQHPETANSLNSLGVLLKDMGDLAGARSYLEQALSIHRKMRGEQHPDTANILNNMGQLLQDMGDLAGARPYFEQALTIRKQVLGEQHPDTAQSLNNMGLLLMVMGQHSAARPYLEQALFVNRKTLGEQHPATANSLTNMGGLLYQIGDLPGAQQYFEQALIVRRQAFGEQHPDTAQSLNNLGALLQAMGDMSAARSYLEQALAIRRQVLGGKHPDTVVSLNNLGLLLQTTGDLAAAQQFLEQTLAISREKLGEQHPYTANSLNSLGMLLKDMGELSAARLYLKQALEIRKQALGEHHPDTATSLNNFGMLLIAMGDLDGARPYIEQAVTACLQAFGENHPTTAASMNNLGRILQEMGDLADARPYLEQTLAINKLLFGEKHPKTAASLNSLGMLLKAMSDLAGARLYLEKALAIREYVLGDQHPDTITSLNNLHMLLKEMGGMTDMPS